MSIQSVTSKETVEACVQVDQVLVTSSRHEELHIATRLAAFKVRSTASRPPRGTRALKGYPSRSLV